MATTQAGVPLLLEGKVALITGGSRGIGAAAVRLFTQAGARVMFNYRSRQEAADALCASCGGGAGNCVGVRYGLHSADEGRQLVQLAVERLGRLDILIANHGIWPPEDAPLDSLTDSQWGQTMHVNLDAVFGLAQGAVRQFKKQGRDGNGVAGHIVLLSSTAGQRGEAFHSDYAATKGALISLTKSWSSELAPDGIYVNAVAPGWVDTEMSAPALGHEPTRDRIFGGIPLGRVGKPEEIAGPALFLCTPLAGFISGEVMNVNGGAVLVG